jgi:cytochrome b involved in lipid metabolism
MMASSTKKMLDPEQSELTSVSSADPSSDTSSNKNACEEVSIEIVNQEASVSPDNTVWTNNDKKLISILVGIVLLVGVGVAIAALLDFMREGDVHFLQTNDTASTTVVTPEELALHDSEEDCWVALYGDVYDFTKYARRHPNGPKDILELAGTDGTTAYGREHSISLLRTVQKDIVGTLSTATEDLY